MITFSITIILCVLIVCLTVRYVLNEILEQRRRETHTGEFEESHD